MSFDGSTWYDQTPGLLQNPTTLAGGPVYYRSIVTNNGNALLSGVTLTDGHGETLGVTTLTVGQTVVSSTGTLTAVDAGRQFDTASVTGTATARTGATRSVPPPTRRTTTRWCRRSWWTSRCRSMAGSTWQDQDALLQGPTTLAGNNVFFRAIVTDTGRDRPDQRGAERPQR